LVRTPSSSSTTTAAAAAAALASSVTEQLQLSGRRTLYARTS